MNDQELHDIFPAETEKSDEWHIRKFKVKEIAQVGKSIAAIFSGIDKGSSIESIIATNVKETAQVVATVCGRSLSEVNELDVDKFADILMSIVELNLSFFDQTLKPRMERLLARFQVTE